MAEVARLVGGRHAEGLLLVEIQGDVRAATVLSDDTEVLLLFAHFHRHLGRLAVAEVVEVERVGYRTGHGLRFFLNDGRTDAVAVASGRIELRRERARKQERRKNQKCCLHIVYRIK